MLPWSQTVRELGVEAHLHRRCMHHQAHDGVEHASAPPKAPEHSMVFDLLDNL